MKCDAQRKCEKGGRGRGWGRRLPIQGKQKPKTINFNVDEPHEMSRKMVTQLNCAGREAAGRRQGLVGRGGVILGAGNTGQERNEKAASPWTREKSIFTIIEVYDETFSYHFASPHKC